MLVKQIYNELATITGFPQYTNDTDMPETNLFLFQVLTESLRSLISKLYISNNVLETTDTIKTIRDKQDYAIRGIVKCVQFIKGDGRVINIPYNDYFNKDIELDKDRPENYGEPKSYVIKKGYLRLLPIPSGVFTIKVTQSTTELVWKNNDTSSSIIDNINDAVIADPRFCRLLVLNAAALVFMRCRNQNADIYANLFRESFDRFIEEDYGTMQAQRGFGGGRAGHYNSEGGLLG